ncbi:MULTISPECIES: hypothetical protein [unclassified Amycolatopsis]|uniref:hypothetical protein n=1 Tax=unclassified Amycolatopsis TaxID=2618356 RepID=UPI0028768A81|nr:MULTISPECIES: hypothetical protein [unclassified Amycolatopsis]MDS0137767.1 hypothetical protein [Amycolatopsis sp. 505]MDS0141961.1 hypothetical protein [Amycolatopsis sp. CM201R]
MRTYYDEDDHEGYAAGQGLLVRRFSGWAAAQGWEVDPYAVVSALEFRHTSVDGRLAYWTAALVRDFLLSYVPRTLSAEAGDAVLLPETLRLFLRYLHETELADPAGDSLADLEDAVGKAAAEFPAAMADERNFGIAKYWVMTAMRNGVDPVDSEAMDAFLAEVRAGQHPYDAELVAGLAGRHLGEQTGRALPQLPVSLPAEAELGAAAERSSLVVKLRKFVEWVGDGRALTGTGALKLADARQLVPLLDTGDRLEWELGREVQRVRSSADLPNLAILFELAKRARIVRVVKGKLVRVAKAAPLLHDALALWRTAFDALPGRGLLVKDSGWGPDYALLLDDCLDFVLPDVLNTIYGMPEPMPVVRLAESVWLACVEGVCVDLEPSIEAIWRDGLMGEFRRLLVVLAGFGAVELTTGPADPMYTMDLVPENPELTPEAQDRLRAALGAPSLELVALTPLGTWAIRERLLREGRVAPLVGELAGASPAAMLGGVSEHFSEDWAGAEIDGWLAAHGGRDTGLPMLLDAVRRCPFRTRASVMLQILVDSLPDGDAVLRGLRTDPALGPIATQLLVERGDLALEDLDAREGLLGITEQFLVLLETAGPEATASTLVEVPADERAHLAEAITTSGHPDGVGIAELAEVFEEVARLSSSPR